MEEDVRDLKELLDVFYKEKDTTWITIHTPQIKNIENILNELDKLQKENKKLISDNLEYQRTQDIFDKRTYRKKYLEERRKEEPSLLYPDADEIYQRYYELKKENEGLKEYIALAPNLDEMTATKYKSIQEEAYIRGRAEEQQKAEQIIYENYIPKSVIQDKIDVLEKIQKEFKNNEELRIKIITYKELLNKGE